MGCAQNMSQTQQTVISDIRRIRHGELHPKLQKVIKEKLSIQETEPVSVTVNWWDQSQGIVEWTLKNNTDKLISVVLLRGWQDFSYIFGDAFWPIYLQYELTTWVSDKPAPLISHSDVTENTPPIALIKVSENQYAVGFLFTLDAGESYSMLEGGFSVLPTVYKAIPVEYLETSDYCIGYNSSMVLAYDSETGLPAMGYFPNPADFKVAVFKLSQQITQPNVVYFPVTVSKGKCVEACSILLENALRSMTENPTSATAWAQLGQAIQCYAQVFAMNTEEAGKRMLDDMTRFFDKLAAEGKTEDKEAVSRIRELFDKLLKKEKET